MRPRRPTGRERRSRRHGGGRETTGGRPVRPACSCAHTSTPCRGPRCPRRCSACRRRGSGSSSRSRMTWPRTFEGRQTPGPSPGRCWRCLPGPPSPPRRDASGPPALPWPWRSPSRRGSPARTCAWAGSWRPQTPWKRDPHPPMSSSSRPTPRRPPAGACRRRRTCTRRTAGARGASAACGCSCPYPQAPQTRTPARTSPWWAAGQRPPTTTGDARFSRAACARASRLRARGTWASEAARSQRFARRGQACSTPWTGAMRGRPWSRASCWGIRRALRRATRAIGSRTWAFRTSWPSRARTSPSWRGCSRPRSPAPTSGRRPGSR